jgi:hypothetical protein
MFVRHGSLVWQHRSPKTPEAVFPDQDLPIKNKTPESIPITFGLVSYWFWSRIIRSLFLSVHLYPHPSRSSSIPISLPIPILILFSIIVRPFHHHHCLSLSISILIPTLISIPHPRHDLFNGCAWQVVCWVSGS